MAFQNNGRMEMKKLMLILIRRSKMRVWKQIRASRTLEKSLRKL